MTQSPTTKSLPIQALRAAAVVLALGAGSWLVVSSQQAANPKAERAVEPAPGSPVAEAPLDETPVVTGNPFPPVGEANLTFLYSSKSFTPPSVTPSLTPVDIEAAIEGEQVQAPTFIHSSKTLNLAPAIRPDSITSPLDPKQ